MNTSKLKPFHELDHSDELVRLDWFGGARGNLDEMGNSLIEGIFTPYEPYDAGTDGIKFKRKKDDQFIAGIAVGYLPMQFIGLCFRGGKPVNINDQIPSETIFFDLDVSDSASVEECHLPDLQIEPDHNFISDRFKSFANPAGLKKLSGKLIATTNKKITRIPAPEVVVIHELELIRFYLTNSSYSCQKLFTGSFTRESLEKRVVNTIHEPVTFNEETSAGRFVYRHGYKEEDVPILGRILFEKNALALRAAQRVSSKIVADHINATSRLIGYPRTLFPFIGKTQLRLSGRRVKTARGFIFLVHRIHSCSAPFPYKSLSFSDEIAPGGKPAPDDAPVIFSNIKTSDIGPAHYDGQVNTGGESTSSEPPSSTSVQLQIELGERIYLGLKDVTFSKRKFGDCTHKSEKKIHRYLDTLINASTGRGTSGESSATRQSITEAISVTPHLESNLDNFAKIVKELAGVNKKWKIDTLMIGEGINFNGINFSKFPPVRCPTRIKVFRQFSFMDALKKVSRQFVCVQVCVDGQYVYLFEAQRRSRDSLPTKSNQSLFKEEMPILLLCKPGYEEIEGNDFLPIIEQTVKNKTWPSEDELNGYVRSDVGARTAVSIKHLIQKSLGK